MRSRKIFGVLLVAIVAAIGLTASASANEYEGSGNSEPQTTNIPYTAWVGTQIRLAKCFDLMDREAGTLLSEADLARVRDGQRVTDASFELRGKYTIEAWSGANNSIVNSPFFVNGANGDRTSQDVVPFVERYRGAKVNLAGLDANQKVDANVKGDEVRPGDEGYRLCFAVHLTSYSPGLAVVKLAIREDLLGLLPGRDPELKHQFLAIFMTASEPTLTEEPGGGDPDGSGAYHPQGSPGSRTWNAGFVKATVKGTFPHGSLGPVFPSGPATITLPDDWETLARKWAVDDNPYAGGEYGSAPMRWDIHDDTVETTEANHQHTSNACSIPGSVYDSVDNCVGLFAPPLWLGNDPDLGPFSRDNTDHDFVPYEIAYPAIGPFDPLRPNSSFLPDGRLNEGDANMPALRVDLDTTGTIGVLQKADKSDVYSLTGNGAADGAIPANLYAPFYKAYIPAANRSGTSGVAGTFGNNFPGFVTDSYKPYDYWDLLLVEDYWNGPNQCKNPLGQVYQGSGGVNSVTLYTDEHGEAWAKYYPDVDPLTGGFALTPTSSGINSICDVSPGVAGVETISARGFYPEQPALGIPFDKSLTKTVYHEGSKTLACAKKTGFNGSTCTETITDLAGNPLKGAWVWFSISNAAGGTLQPDTNAGKKQEGPNSWWIETDNAGKATVYVTNSDDNCMDIRAENVGTRWTDGAVGIERTFKIRPTTGVACGTPPVVVGGGSNGGGGSTGGGGSAAGSAVTVSLGGPIVPAAPVLQAGTTKTAVIASNSARLFSVKVLQTKLGRYLVVNVKGTAKTANVRIQIMGKNGKVLKTIVRTVPTNKAFKIANFKLAKTAVSVKASVLTTA